VVHRATEMKRAMKCIKKKNVVTTSKEKEMFNEAKILSRLDHPNIIKLFELFQDAKYYYMITEQCSGGELFDRIQEISSFTEEQAAEYMQQLLSAIFYCHKARIMHRDLKPENILLESSAKNSLIKLIDFGVATIFEPGQNSNEKYGTVLIFHCPAYFLMDFSLTTLLLKSLRRTTMKNATFGPVV
jgi:calcium-dependent protein kinase